MKSKKKLIYKLHENINENPFKKIDEVSFRNAGTGSYDFNKLKSIRAISLKGLEVDEIHSEKNPSDWKKKYDLKMNMVSIKQEIQQKAQQALICNKKKIIIDKSLINTQSKKLNIRSLLKEKHLEDKHYLTENKETLNQDQLNSINEGQSTNHQNRETEITDLQRHNLPARTSPRPKYQQGHSRNISLPVIKNTKQQTQNSMTFVSPKHQLDMLVQEQRAKQQILRQIRLNAQEKINKQVLMSIKLKSIQNLERIARSQSQVIKIDKWKQKYGHLKNSQQIKLKEKFLCNKGLLPEIQQKLSEKNQYESPKYIKPSYRYSDSNDQQLGQLQKSQIQLAKHLLNSVQVEEPIFSYNSTILQRQFSQLQTGWNEQKLNKLDYEYGSETLIKEKQQNNQFWYSQPLKITITQLKNNSTKNQHHQNSFKESKKFSKNKAKNVKQTRNQGIEKSLENEPNSYESPKNIQILESDRGQSLPYPTQSQFMTKNKLYMSVEKVNCGYEEPVEVSSTVGLTNKKATNRKCKINQENTILDQIIDYGVPKEWEMNKFADDQTDFHTFVKNEAQNIEVEKQKVESFNSNALI